LGTADGALHRGAAGVDTELHVFEGMPHATFSGTAPEDRELLAEVRRFEDEHLAGRKAW
jgi:hypothetical protein